MMSQLRTVEVRTQLSLAELYRANFLVFDTFEVKKAILLLISAAFLGAMIWKLLSASGNGQLSEVSPAVGLVLFPLALGGVAFGIPYVVLRTQVRKRPKMLGPAEYSFSVQGVQMVGPFGRSELVWAAFERIRETKEFFFLYFLARQAYVLPKRCFASRAEIAEFREMIRGSHPGKLELRSPND